MFKDKASGNFLNISPKLRQLLPYLLKKTPTLVSAFLLYDSFFYFGNFFATSFLLFGHGIRLDTRASPERLIQ